MSVADDRWAIADTLQGYARCLDRFDFDGVAALFSSDAVIDYGGYPEMRGGVETAKFLEKHTAGNAWHQHLLSIVDVQLDGDRAQTVTYFVAHSSGQSSPDLVRVHVGEYRDHLARLPEGWRIVERHQSSSWKETRRQQPS
jgi:ketosteroid isomerase-like protein